MRLMIITDIPVESAGVVGMRRACGWLAEPSSPFVPGAGGLGKSRQNDDAVAEWW